MLLGKSDLSPGLLVVVLLHLEIRKHLFWFSKTVAFVNFLQVSGNNGHT